MTDTPVASVPRIGPDLLTIPETAERLRIQPRTVYRLIAAGDLKVIDISRSDTPRSRLRVRVTDLEEFVASRAVDNDAPTVEDVIAATS